MAVGRAGVDPCQRAPRRDHAQGAGGELEHPRMRVVVAGKPVAAQPQQRQQPPDHPDHRRQLEQHQRGAGAGARGPHDRHHQRQVRHQQHAAGERVLDLRQVEPFPQSGQEQHRSQRHHPFGRQQQDRCDRERGHHQCGQQADSGHSSVSLWIRHSINLSALPFPSPASRGAKRSVCEPSARATRSALRLCLRAGRARVGGIDSVGFNLFVPNQWAGPRSARRSGRSGARGPHRHPVRVAVSPHPVRATTCR